MERREGRRVSGKGQADVAPWVHDLRLQHAQEGPGAGESPLKPARRADPAEGPNQKSQVEAADVDHETFQDVRVPAQMGAPHAAGLIEMGMRSFQSLASSPLQRGFKFRRVARRSRRTWARSNRWPSQCSQKLMDMSVSQDPRT